MKTVNVPNKHLKSLSFISTLQVSKETFDNYLDKNLNKEQKSTKK